MVNLTYDSWKTGIDQSWPLTQHEAWKMLPSSDGIQKCLRMSSAALGQITAAASTQRDEWPVSLNEAGVWWAFPPNIILLSEDDKGLGTSFSSHQILLTWLLADGVGIFQDSPDRICLVSLSHSVSDPVSYLFKWKIWLAQSYFQVLYNLIGHKQQLRNKTPLDLAQVIGLAVRGLNKHTQIYTWMFAVIVGVALLFLGTPKEFWKILPLESSWGCSNTNKEHYR